MAWRNSCLHWLHNVTLSGRSMLFAASFFIFTGFADPMRTKVQGKAFVFRLCFQVFVIRFLLAAPGHHDTIITTSRWLGSGICWSLIMKPQIRRQYICFIYYVYRDSETTFRGDQIVLSEHFCIFIGCISCNNDSFKYIHVSNKS